MYPKYYILLLGLFLLGGSLSAKSYNEQTGHAPNERPDDFYIDDEQQDWPNDDYGDDGDDEASGMEGSGIEEEGSAEGPKTLCMNVRETLREKHLAAYIPRCTDAGEFESLQCNYQTGECWCVTRNGDKIPNTVRRPPHKPSCDGSDVMPILPSDHKPPKGKPDSSEETEDNGIDIDEPTDPNGIDIAPPGGEGTETEIPNKIDPIAPEIIKTEDNNHMGASASNPESEPMKSGSIVGEPGILAGIIGGAVVGLLCAVLLVMFIVYRMRKKDEGSYALDEPKRSPSLGYTKARDREFFA